MSNPGVFRFLKVPTHPLAQQSFEPPAKNELPFVSFAPIVVPNSPLLSAPPIFLQGLRIEILDA
jgi:hypothetical protein